MKKKQVRTSSSEEITPQPQRRCWGLLRSSYYMKRCGRQVDGLYCGDHRRQPLVLPIALLIALLAVVSDFGQVVQALTPMSAEERALRRTAYTRISMTAHAWKMTYFSLHPQGMNVAAIDPNGPSRNVWEVLQSQGIPEFNRENWIRYYPLFREHVETLCKGFQDAQSAYADILEPSMRTRMDETCSNLRASGTVYYWLPRGGLGKDTPMGFRSSFVQAFVELGKLDAEAQRHREEYSER